MTVKESAAGEDLAEADFRATPRLITRNGNTFTPQLALGIGGAILIKDT